MPAAARYSLPAAPMLAATAIQSLDHALAIERDTFVCPGLPFRQGYTQRASTRPGCLRAVLGCWTRWICWTGWTGWICAAC